MCLSRSCLDKLLNPPGVLRLLPPNFRPGTFMQTRFLELSNQLTNAVSSHNANKELWGDSNNVSQIRTCSCAPAAISVLFYPSMLTLRSIVVQVDQSRLALQTVIVYDSIRLASSVSRYGACKTCNHSS
jgi:hypothetical protein